MMRRGTSARNLLFTLAAVFQLADSFSPHRIINVKRYVDYGSGGSTANRAYLQSNPAFLKFSKASTRLWESVSVESAGASNLTSSNEKAAAASTPPAATTSNKAHKKYDMPWGEFQEWAMKDYLSKYTVQVHIEEDGRDTLKVYTLWRTLSNDVTALSGYPLIFLVERYKEMRNETDIQTSTEVLPYLDGFAFESDGGVSGRVYGIAGVADGTRIQTTPVSGVESTLQKGYISTQEGIVYELGLPASETFALDGRMKMADRAASSIKTAAAEVELSDMVETGELVKLGALTAVVLGGAWAMETLSHHLTVNVFWV